MKKLIFIMFHFIMAVLAFFAIIKINNSYGYVCCYPIICIVLLIDIFSFSSHIKKYPLNNLNEYKFNIFQDKIADVVNGIYTISIEKKGNVYFVKSGDKSLKFNMKGCICPINYIRAYFIRNIHFPIYNKKKCSVLRLASSFKVSHKFKYQNLKIRFFINNKVKTYWLIKKSKTKLNFLMKEIIGLPFVHLGLSKRGHLSEHFNMNEKNYSIMK